MARMAANSVYQKTGVQPSDVQVDLSTPTPRPPQNSYFFRIHLEERSMAMKLTFVIRWAKIR